MARKPTTCSRVNEVAMKPTRELVLRKVTEYWPAEAHGTMLLLDDVANIGSTEQELARVQLAVLKLSGGDRDKLVANIEAANRDPRDVLAYAEYPRQMAAHHLNHFNLTKAEQLESKEIRESDRRQYLDWLNGDGHNDSDA